MEIISTNNAPAAVGPYSQAIKIDASKSLIFCSGQLGIVPDTGKMINNSLTPQIEQIFHNISAVLSKAGSSLDKVIKCTVFLKNMDDFKEFNQVYAQMFDGHKPARSAFQAARLPLDALVEIEVIATA